MEHLNLKSRFSITFLVTAVLLAALLFSGIRLGQDLKGGTTLRFSLDLDRAEKTGRIPVGTREKVVADTLKVIDQRINSTGLAEIELLPVGEDKFTISLPADSAGDTDSIIDLVTALGDLQFRITVKPTEQYQRRDGELPARLLQPGAAPWAGAEGYPPTTEGFNKYKTDEVAAWNAAESAGTPYIPRDSRYTVVLRNNAKGIAVTDFEVLEVPATDEETFDGRILVNPSVSKGQTGMPVVVYNVKGEFQNVFGQWTERNIGLPMAIVLNERFYTDPVINSKLTDSVQITLGSGRTYKELNAEAERIATVLQTGSLKVRPELLSRNKTGARLAGESKRRGMMAVAVAFMLVLLFMLYFYRQSGVVANIALLLNVVLLLGALSFFKAVLTLPGIAGIVLTVGMAVDANILINERIREEILAGRSLRRAITEGYNRAFTTIVDANVTSLITAIFLYIYGSGSVRGFAVTLAIGLVVSMFTSIYVTRTIFEWRLKSGKLKSWSMVGTGLPPKISWIALRRYFAPLSVLGVVFGLLVFAGEDKYKFYDVDFTGGLKLQARFKESTSVDQVRAALRSGSREITVETKELDKDDNLVLMRHDITAGPYDKCTVVAVGDAGEGVEVTVQRGIEAQDADSDVPSIAIQEMAFETFVREVLADRLLPVWLADGPTVWHAAEDEQDEELKAIGSGVHLIVNLSDPQDVLTPERLSTAVKAGMPVLKRGEGEAGGVLPAKDVTRTLVIRSRASEHAKLKTYEIWMKTLNQAGNPVEQRPDLVRSTFSTFLGGKGIATALEAQGVSKDAAATVGLSEPFPSVDVIGTTVAKRMQNDALIALVLSLLGIIVYIALRFSSRAMGLSAVLCLFHDVAITLGIVAVANLYHIVDAKISLPMVAAFLTLVGYSVNDTVVVFDRIRENRGKKRVITPQMIDLSINQTLARTIKTSATFLLAAVALFVFNIGQRNVLEGFSFILIIGSVIGTYSTVAIASPLLLFIPWVWERVKQWRPRPGIVTRLASRWYSLPFVPIAAILWVLWLIVFGVIAFFVGLVLFPVWALTAKVEAVEMEPDGETIPV